MEPEIARRCKSCGAAIRPRSSFCPQCGVAVVEGSVVDAPPGVFATPAPEKPPQQTLIDPVPNMETVAPAATVATEAPLQAETPAPLDASGENNAAPVSPIENPPSVNVVAPNTAVAPGVAPPADAVPGKRQRVTAVAREVVDESVRPRAEKLRRASNVVLDEAAADPSLRFVLVATALIILSLLLLLLGRIL